MRFALNDNIKNLRVLNGYNQVEFAKKLNISKQCVSNWENGNVMPSVDMLVKIAECFNVSTEYLLGRCDLDVISVKGLTAEQKTHVGMLVADLLAANKKQ